VGRKQRKYSLEFKQRAVALAKELGNIAEAAKKLGLPKHSLYNWANPEEGTKPMLEISAEEKIRQLEQKMNRSRRLTSSSSRPPLFLSGPSQIRFEMVVKYREKIDVKALCLILGLSRSGFYAWLKRPKSKRDSENASLVEKMRKIHAESRETYGAPRITEALKKRAIPSVTTGWRS